MFKKLLVVTAGMFAFGYALVPMYKAICEFTGINILALGEREIPGSGNARAKAKNTQVDASRTITVEFDANARGPWKFKPAQSSLQVHPGEMMTVMYEFENVQDRHHVGPSHSQLCATSSGSAFQQVGMFLFQPIHLGPWRKKAVACGVCD